MMSEDIKIGLETGRLKEIPLMEAEVLSRNEQFLQLMRKSKSNIRAYWDEEKSIVRFGVIEIEK